MSASLQQPLKLQSAFSNGDGLPDGADALKHAHGGSITMGQSAGASTHIESPVRQAECTGGLARDLEEGVPRSPSERDPLCSLATNRGNGGMQGKWRLAIAIVLCTIFMIGEVVGGVYAHSLAVLTDAAHMLSDVSAFAISLFAGIYALRAAGVDHTFGYHRVEVLGGMLSVLIIWVVTGVLVFEAVQRCRHPEDVDGKIMFILAVSGIVVNLLTLAVLGGHHGHSHGGHDHGNGSHSHGGHEHSLDGGTHKHDLGEEDAPHAGQLTHVEAEAPTAASAHAQGHSHGAPAPAGGHGGSHAGHGHSEGAGHACSGQVHSHEAHGPSQGHAGHGHGHGGHSHESLGMKGAVIHVLGDCVQSAGVALAAILIWVKPEWKIADPLCTFVFAVLVLLTTRGMVRDILDIVMERVPRGLDIEHLADGFNAIEGVKDIHDLHVWAIKPGMLVLAMHVDILPDEDAAEVLRRITKRCRARGIDHSTIQLSAHGEVCPCVPSPSEKLRLEDTHNGHSH